MVNIDQWMKGYQNTIKNLFGSRILFIGLQGSYGRNEATEHSDIDVVLILDTVSLEDLKQYQQAIQGLPDWHLLCGFVSGKEELSGWLRADLFQFYHDTIPYYGNLDTIIPQLTQADAQNAVLMGACNLYHMCSHNYWHGSDIDTIRGLYKPAVFVLQAKHCAETGNYIRNHSMLNKVLTGTDLIILEYSSQLKAAENLQTSEQYSEIMLQWASKLIRRYKRS